MRGRAGGQLHRRRSDSAKTAVSFTTLPRVKSSPTPPEPQKSQSWFDFRPVKVVAEVIPPSFGKSKSWKSHLWQVRIKSRRQTFKWIKDKSLCDERKWWDFSGNWLDWLEGSQDTGGGSDRTSAAHTFNREKLRASLHLFTRMGARRQRARKASQIPKREGEKERDGERQRERKNCRVNFVFLDLFLFMYV